MVEVNKDTFLYLKQVKEIISSNGESFNME